MGLDLAQRPRKFRLTDSLHPKSACGVRLRACQVMKSRPKTKPLCRRCRVGVRLPILHHSLRDQRRIVRIKWQRFHNGTNAINEGYRIDPHLPQIKNSDRRRNRASKGKFPRMPHIDERVRLYSDRCRVDAYVVRRDRHIIYSVLFADIAMLCPNSSNKMETSVRITDILISTIS